MITCSKRQVIMKFNLIAKNYIKGWFLVDGISSIPFDTASLIFSFDLPQLLKMNKVLRLPRLFKAMRTIRQSKNFVMWLQRMQVDAAAIRLFELVLVLVLGWHYIGCFWWYFSSKTRTPASTLAVLGADCEMQCVDDAAVSLEYLASFYWAIMMTTGLNVGIAPGNSEGQIAYECFVSFLGVLLQVCSRAPCDVSGAVPCVLLCHMPCSAVPHPCRTLHAGVHAGSCRFGDPADGCQGCADPKTA